MEIAELRKKGHVDESSVDEERLEAARGIPLLFEWLSGKGEAKDAAQEAFRKCSGCGVSSTC